MVAVLTGRYGVASLAGFILGFVLILLSELAGMEWARVFGAGFISIGGIGLGVLVGLDQPRRRAWLTRLRDQRVLLGMIAAVIMVLPVLVALAATLVAIPGALGDGGNGGVITLGGLIAFAMLVASVGCFVLAVAAIRRAARESTSAAETNGVHEEAV